MRAPTSPYTKKTWGISNVEGTFSLSFNGQTVSGLGFEIFLRFWEPREDLPPITLNTSDISGVDFSFDVFKVEPGDSNAVWLDCIPLDMFVMPEQGTNTSACLSEIPGYTKFPATSFVHDSCRSYTGSTVEACSTHCKAVSDCARLQCQRSRTPTT